jgi:drug/metabolite transporter (DMT)-like permease
MGTAGVAWGIYSILGRGVSNPVHATAKNFLKTVPLTLMISIFWLGARRVSAEGFLWAALSGSLTSAVGYVLWYAALRGLSATLAATVQLSVPALAAAGGVVLLSEQLTWRLILAGALILTGVALAIYGRRM